MDFLDPKKKRTRTIRLFIGYVLISIALLLGSVLLLFAAFGYGINRSTGEVIQNGLVFVDAHPQQATMYLNGQDKGGTDGRFVLEAGKYTLELRRDGYIPWKRDFQLDGGIIVRLVYPFLFPEKLVSRDVLPLSVQPDMVTQSPDRKWIITHKPDAVLNFQVTDTSQKELPITTIAISENLLNGLPAPLTFEAAEWSTDNRHVLLKVAYAGGYDYIVLDRDAPQSSYSVSQTFGKQFSRVTLRDKKFNELYLYDQNGGILQTGSVVSSVISPVATDVLAFWPYKADTVLYATNERAQADKTLIRIKEGQADYTLKEVSRSQTYLLNMAEFDSDTYIVAGTQADGRVYTFKNALAQLKDQNEAAPLPYRTERIENAQFVSFSNNTRFISIQSGSQFAIHDLETKLNYKYDTKLNIPAAQKVAWMDGHRLMTVADNKMYVWDYDNLNRRELVGATPITPMFDRDYNQLFTISPSTTDPKVLSLLRTDLNLGIE